MLTDGSSRNFALWTALGILLSQVCSSASHVVRAFAGRLITFTPAGEPPVPLVPRLEIELAFSIAFFLTIWFVARRGLSVRPGRRIGENHRRWIPAACLLTIGLLGCGLDFLGDLHSLDGIWAFRDWERWSNPLPAVVTQHPFLILDLRSLGFSLLAICSLPWRRLLPSRDSHSDEALTTTEFMKRRRDRLMTEHGLTRQEAQELEEHLLDHKAEIQAEGTPERLARAEAARRLGSLEELAEAYRRGDPSRIWRHRILAMAAGVLIRHTATALAMLLSVLLMGISKYSLWWARSIHDHYWMLQLWLPILISAGLLRVTGSHRFMEMIAPLGRRVGWLFWVPLMAQVGVRAFFRVSTPSVWNVSFLEFVLGFFQPIAFACLGAFLVRGRQNHYLHRI